MILDNWLIKIYRTQAIQLASACIFFLLTTFLASYKVIPLFGMITYGDGAYFHNIKSSWVDIATTFSSNYLGQDQSNILLTYVPRVAHILLFKFMGLSDNMISYLLFFGLFFVACMTYCLIFYKISKNIYFGVLAGLFVVLNNLSIEHIIFGAGFYYFYGIISFGFLLYMLWRIYQKKELHYKYCVIIILNSLLIVHPFYFIIYLTLLSLFFIFYHISEYNGSKKNLFKYGMTLLGILAIHSYWLIPFIIGSLNRPPESTYGGNLANVFDGFLSVSSYINAINFFHYPGFISRNFHQTFWHYIFYIGIIALIVVSLFSIKKSKNKSFSVFILFSYIIFFNLALGPKSTIFGEIWLYLWNNIQFFKFFRSFTRFLVIIIPLYLFYFAIFDIDWKYKYKNIIYTIIIVIILLLNMSALTGDFNGNILATKIPEEYLNLNGYLDEDNNVGTIVTFPTIHYEGYIWGINNNTKIVRQNYYLKDYLFVKPILYERTSLNLVSKNKIFYDIFGYANVRHFGNTFENMNIGYILVQKDLLNIFSLHGVDYKIYEEYFGSNPNYQIVVNNKYFSLYKFKKMTHILKSDNIYFEKINPTKYKIFMKDVRSDTNLSFLQNFHQNWELYIERNPSNSFCWPIEDHKMDIETRAGTITKINECRHKKIFFEGEELSYLYKNSIFDESHTSVNGYANGWIIDPEYIKKSYSPEYYDINSDGSINIELVLYFKTQSYFYLGLIISSITLLICIFYLTLKSGRKNE